MAEQPKL